MDDRYYVSRDDYCAVVKDRSNNEYFLGADVIAARLNQLERELAERRWRTKDQAKHIKELQRIESAAQQVGKEWACCTDTTNPNAWEVCIDNLCKTLGDGWLAKTLETRTDTDIVMEDAVIEIKRSSDE